MPTESCCPTRPESPICDAHTWSFRADERQVAVLIEGALRHIGLQLTIPVEHAIRMLGAVHEQTNLLAVFRQQSPDLAVMRSLWCPSPARSEKTVRHLSTATEILSSAGGGRTCGPRRAGRFTGWRVANSKGDPDCDTSRRLSRPSRVRRYPRLRRVPLDPQAVVKGGLRLAVLGDRGDQVHCLVSEALEPVARATKR